jgi:hypothetical protein
MNHLTLLGKCKHCGEFLYWYNDEERMAWLDLTNPCLHELDDEDAKRWEGVYW